MKKINWIVRIKNKAFWGSTDPGTVAVEYKPIAGSVWVYNRPWKPWRQGF
ncbi:phage holin family protein [Mediterraneibacter gnavus]|nr:phage holin family protein [Mediterraneibacter gnavus]